jgi:adenylate cyclase
VPNEIGGTTLVYDVIVLVAAVVILVAVVVAIATLRVVYNVISPRLAARLLLKNDLMFLDFQGVYGWRRPLHRLNRSLPTNPRCKLCYVPFGGLGRLLGIRPSRKNPNFCRGCFESAPMGGHELEVGVLFADARGFTAWAAGEAPTEVAAALNRFYGGAAASLMAHDAIIDKFSGDEVMAIFVSAIPSLGAKTCDQMLAAAEEMMVAAKGSFRELPIGVGLHCGTAWVGNVGTDGMKDFTALGDVVNVAARLQGCAGPGQIVMSEDVYSRLAAPPQAAEQQFEVKGKVTPCGPASLRPKYVHRDFAIGAQSLQSPSNATGHRVLVRGSRLIGGLHSCLVAL